MNGENVIIRCGDMMAEISPLGAELQSVKCGEREYLYDGSADWAGRAPLLFPVAGRLREDAYEIDGIRYHLPQHGFARRRMFTIHDQRADSVTFVLTDDEETRAVYPARFAMYATYTLRAGMLEASVCVENRGDMPLYFGFGNHEAFVADPDKSGYTLRFDKEENLTALYAGDGLLIGGGDDLGRGVKDLALKSDYFDGGATLIFRDIASREVTLLKENNPVLRLRFDAPHLLVWCKSTTSPFLCIEPWINLPDDAGTDLDFTKKPGVVTLARGGKYQVSHTVTFL